MFKRIITYLISPLLLICLLVSCGHPKQSAMDEAGLSPAEQEQALVDARADENEANRQSEVPDAQTQQVRSALRDPESAKIFSYGNGCGTVNARNGFGGYGGAQRYIVTADGPKFEGSMTEGAMDALWKANGCPRFDLPTGSK